MIHLSGFSERTERQPDGDVKIEITGLRPGEKLFEELLIGDDVIETIHPKIMRAQEKMLSSDELNGYLSQLEQAYEANDCKRIRAVLLTVVDEYAPQCDVQDWLKALNH
jgi:FlaA1/EpsC-like NDP-sugar epimerase